MYFRKLLTLVHSLIGGHCDRRRSLGVRPLIADL